jgi:hypothetical protein
MLREISAAGDRERTGAFDVEWDGAHASFFFLFGHPSHVVFESADGRRLVGDDALTTLVAELPTEFHVAPWRRAMVTEDSLRLTAEDLMALFDADARVAANGGSATPHDADAPGAMSFERPGESGAADGLTPPPPPAPPEGAPRPTVGLQDFPLLPLGAVLFSDAMANVASLEAVVPRLRECLLVLVGPDHRGAALVADGGIADAVWVTGSSGLLGDDAAVALVTSTEGHLTAHRIEDERLVAVLPVLWRGQRVPVSLPAGWLHPNDLVAEVRSSGRTCALLVDAAENGVALFYEGALVAVYSTEHRWPAASMSALRDLLHQPEARVTIVGDVGAPRTAEERAPASATEDAAPRLTLEAALASADAASAATQGVDVEDSASDSTAEASPPVEDGLGAVDEDPTWSFEADLPDAEPAAVADAEPGGAEPEAEAEAPVEAEAETDAVPDADAVTESEVEPVAVAVAVADPKAEVDAVADGDAVTDGDAYAYAYAYADAVADSDAVTEPEVEPATELETVAAAVDEASANGEAPFELSADQTTAVTTETPDDVDDIDAAAADLTFEEAVLNIAAPELDEADEPTFVELADAQAEKEFVPARLDIDVDALRAELTEIALVWLGADDAAPVAAAIAVARPGVDDFVAMIAAIGLMEIPGHESAVVRAMAREMHYRATEVLCGV